jgi:hypothetical protein
MSICPFMSKPLAYTDREVYLTVEMYEQYCLEEGCQLWVPSSAGEQGHCGMMRHES